MAPTGFLRVYYGCMCSGKTTSALVEASRYVAQGDKLLIIGSSKDTRSEAALSSHSAVLNTDKYIGKKYLELPPLPENSKMFEDIHIVLIDEAQFFGPDIVEFCRYLVEEMGKYVIVSGLDLDYMRKPMGHVLRLASMANESHHLMAVCKCGKPAQFTYRSLSLGTSLIIIGGTETYVPTCRNCWLEKVRGDSKASGTGEELLWM